MREILQEVIVKAESHFGKSATFLGNNGLIREVSMARGYRNLGEREIIGVYEFLKERISGPDGTSLVRHIVKQDTQVEPILRGVVLTDGEVSGFVGFDQRPSIEVVRSMIDAFNSCPKHRLLNPKEIV